MKKLICLVLIFSFMLTACSKWKVEVLDPREPIETEQELVIPEEESEAEISVPEDEKKEERIFYLSKAAYMDYGPKYMKGKAQWNSDNTLTFQNENTLRTLSSENEIIKTVTLPKEHLPEDGGYDLSWNEKYILAIDKQIESSWNQFGVVYFTDDGKVFLANVSLFDREGNLIKEYYKGDVYGYNENDNYEVYLPVPEGSKYRGDCYLADGNRIHWISEDEAILECHLWVIYYDFSKDEGKIIDDMGKLGEKYGKFSVYYGVEINQCGVLNGDFYYLAHKDEEAGTIWKANKDGSEELFGGKRFMHFFIGREVLVAIEAIDGNSHENGCVVYVAEPENPELKEIFRGNIEFPFGDDGQIRFYNSYNGEDRILYSYNYKTGELTEDSENTDFEIETIVPEYTKYIMKSRDGKYFVEYVSEENEPQLRVMPCE